MKRKHFSLTGSKFFPTTVGCVTSVTTLEAAQNSSLSDNLQILQHSPPFLGPRAFFCVFLAAAAFFFLPCPWAMSVPSNNNRSNYRPSVYYRARECASVFIRPNPLPQSRALCVCWGKKITKKFMRRGVGQRLLNATRTFYVPSVSELLAKVVDRWI